MLPAYDQHTPTNPRFIIYEKEKDESKKTDRPEFRADCILPYSFPLEKRVYKVQKVFRKIIEFAFN